MLLLGVSCQFAFAGNQADISGRVIDDAGHPVADAAVMIYHAGPVTGYSLFCPSCYADCGKRALTDHDGRFAFHHLKQGLWFELLVAKAGYEPKFGGKVNPTTGAFVKTELERRPSISNSGRAFHGLVVDSHGLPQADAVVQPVGGLWDPKTGTILFGSVPGLDPVAVTNSRGVFEIDSFAPERKMMLPFVGPPLSILVTVEARGMAEKFSTVPAGQEAQRITVMDGDVVRGRLVRDGKPVAGAEVGLIGYPRGIWGPGFKLTGSPYDEIRIGTRSDGSFEIDNVPVPGNWYVYAKMESVAARGATGNVRCSTQENGKVLDIGDLALKPGYRVQGRVVLSDGKSIPDGMRVTISAQEAWDSQTLMLPPGGEFAFAGLAAGSYSIFASVKGYSPGVAPVSFKAGDGRLHSYTPPPPPISIRSNVDGLTLTLHPDAAPNP